jgi:hypothetical protein
MSRLNPICASYIYNLPLLWWDGGGGGIVEYKVHQLYTKRKYTVIIKDMWMASSSSAVNKVTVSCKFLYGIS